MTRAPCLALLLAAACGGQEAGTRPRGTGGTGGEPVPPRECPFPVPEPVSLHELGAVEPDAWIEFGSCGHLLVEQAGDVRLAAPDLASLELLPWPDGWSNEGNASFASPIGDWLIRVNAAGLAVLDLVSGRETLGPRPIMLWVSSDGSGQRSVLGRCESDGELIAFDGEDERRFPAPGFRCSGARSLGWASAPVLTYVDDDRGGRVMAADFDVGRAVDLNLSSPLEAPGPDGRTVFRLDDLLPSPDGSRLFFQEAWQDPDTGEVHAVPEVRIVDLAGGTAPSIALADDAPARVAIFGDHSFAWRAGAGTSVLTDDLELRSLELTLVEFHSAAAFDGRGTTYASRGDVVERFWVDLREPRALAIGSLLAGALTSRDGALVVGCPVDDGAGACPAATLRVLEPPAVVRDLRLDEAGQAIWVGTSGSLLVRSAPGDRLVILDPEGRVLGSYAVPARADARVWEAADRLIVGFTGGPLDVVAPATGAVTHLADRALEWWSDRAGRRIAFVVERDGVRVLAAGAIP